MDVYVEQVGDVWLVEAVDENLWGATPVYVKLSGQWVDDMTRDMVRINRGDETAANRLKMALETGAPELVADGFADFYGQVCGNRVARQRVGLKAVTRDGDDDLKAVQEGAPVRPWNAARKNNTDVQEFVKRRRNARPGKKP